MQIKVCNCQTKGVLSINSLQGRTQPETDCLQHSKEKVDSIHVTHLNRGRGIKRDREKRENITCIKFSQMNIVTHIVL